MKNKKVFSFKNFVKNLPPKKEMPRDLYLEMEKFISCLKLSLNKEQNEFLEKIRSISNDSEEYEYADSERICIVGDLESEKLYNEIAERGCCGSFDKKYEIPGGIKIKFGFNYGH